jgi:hypothetical protein
MRRHESEAPLVLVADSERAVEALASSGTKPAHALAWIGWRLVAGDPAAPFTLTKTAAGAPVAQGGWAISLSHVGGRAGVAPIVAVALATRGPLGIDVERPRTITMPQPWLVALERIGDGNPLVGWTRIEALGKAQGTGVGAVLEALRPMINAQTAEATSEGFDRIARQHQLTVTQIGPLPDAVIAMARPVDMSPPRVERLTSEDVLRALGQVPP